MATSEAEPIVLSVVHSRTTPNLPLKGPAINVRRCYEELEDIITSEEYFAQHGMEPGIHLRLQNIKFLDDLTTQSKDPLLIMMVLKDHESWGRNRSVDDFFTLLTSFSHPAKQTSVTMLTSNFTEFSRIKERMLIHVRNYAQFSLIFRNDFARYGGENHNNDNIQAGRRRMIARYRNFALMSTLETWHKHVVWLDADGFKVPSDLITKMIDSNLDIVEPICYQGSNEYDLNAWVGQRKKLPQDRDGVRRYVKHLSDFVAKLDEFVPLDSVGGTMLYVRADIHRQGVIFPHHYVIGSEWGKEGYDGIETEGLCYQAHFLGYWCWGMPHDFIYHV